MLLCKTEEDSGDRMRREGVNADGWERAQERRPCGLRKASPLSWTCEACPLPPVESF
jgi:hypothetical protein